MKECFVPRDFKPESVARIKIANRIIADYQRQGFRLTLRQLYYQFVAREGLPNTAKSYKGLAALVSDARLAGLVDWDAIEDRGRVPWTPSEFGGLRDLARSALRAYRLDRWETQPAYVELWVEKEALAGVLRPLASEFHVTLMTNKGYSSSSAMYAAAQRFVERDDRHRSLFYLGDHDPSGEDMVRDVRDRLATFGAHVDVRKLALTMAQIEKHAPPPNPAKRSDSRAAAYIERYGDESWEVDALEPAALAALVRAAFAEVVDVEAFDAVKAREEVDKRAFVAVVDRTDWAAEAAALAKPTRKRRK